jgi:hypothetical protein
MLRGTSSAEDIAIETRTLPLDLKINRTDAGSRSTLCFGNLLEVVV